MSTSDPLIGRKIGNYLIVDFLGAGAMASVYKAKDPDGAVAALKILQESPLLEKNLIDRFKREAEATKSLRKHPNIITVYETGQDGPFHFIAMECIEGGKSLEDIISQTRLSINRAVELTLQIAQALDYAHKNGVIHRDVKPANVMLNEFGEAILTDFGLVKPEWEPKLTATGALLGTPVYMSPEQTRGEKVNAQSDIYSLGVMLFEMLTNKTPFGLDTGEETIQDLLNKIRLKEAPSPRRYNRHIDRRIEAVVLKCLEKSLKKRYQKMADLVADLNKYKEGEPVSARKPSVFDYFERNFRRHIALAGSLLGTLVVGLIVAFFVRKQIQEQKGVTTLTLTEKESLSRELKRAKSEEKPVPSTGMQRHLSNIKQVQTLSAEEKFPEALALLSGILKENPAPRVSAQVYLETGRIHILQNNKEMAEKDFLQVLSVQPEQKWLSAWAILETGILKFKKGNVSEATLKYETLLTPSYSDQEPQHKIAEFMLGQDKPAVFEKEISKFPRQFQNDGYYCLGLKSEKSGNASLAKEFYRKCLEVSDDKEWPAALVSVLN